MKMAAAGMAVRRMLGVGGPLVLRRALILGRGQAAVILMLGCMMDFFFRRVRRAGDGADRP